MKTKILTLFLPIIIIVTITLLPSIQGQDMGNVRNQTPKTIYEIFGIAKTVQPTPFGCIYEPGLDILLSWSENLNMNCDVVGYSISSSGIAYILGMISFVIFMIWRKRK